MALHLHLILLIMVKKLLVSNRKKLAKNLPISEI